MPRRICVRARTDPQSAQLRWLGWDRQTDGRIAALLNVPPPPLRRGHKNVTNADDIGKNRLRCGLLMTYSTKLGLLTNDVALQ